MGDTSPKYFSNSKYRNPTFYYVGTKDPLGMQCGISRKAHSHKLRSLGNMEES